MIKENKQKQLMEEKVLRDAKAGTWKAGTEARPSSRSDCLSGLLSLFSYISQPVQGCHSPQWPGPFHSNDQSRIVSRLACKPIWWGGGIFSSEDSSQMSLAWIKLAKIYQDKYQARNLRKYMKISKNAIRCSR